MVWGSIKRMKVRKCHCVLENDKQFAISWKEEDLIQKEGDSQNTCHVAAHPVVAQEGVGKEKESLISLASFRGDFNHPGKEQLK